MFNRITAKEKAKTLIRERSFWDLFGLMIIQFLKIILTAIPLILLPVMISAIITARTAAYMSSLMSGGLSSFGGGFGLPTVPVGSIVTVSIIVSVVAALIAIAIEQFYNTGMVRASLRLSRGDSKVRVVDVLLAGNNLGRNICVTLWSIFFIFAWNLPSIGVAVLLVVLAATGNITTTAAVVVSAILLILAYIWSIYITINRALAYSFAYHISEDNRYSALDCVRASADLTSGSVWSLFVAHLSFLGWDFIGSAFWANAYVSPYKYLTFAGIYEQLTGTFKPVETSEKVWESSIPASAAKPKVAIPTIEIASGEYSGSTFNLTSGEEIVIGRDPSLANVVVSPENTAISKVHCRIRFDEKSGQYIITDHSTNGTFVNGEKLINGRPFVTSRRSVVKLAEGAMTLKLI